MATDQLDGVLGVLDPTGSDLDLDAEVDATGHILELLFQELLRRSDRWPPTPAAIPSSPGDCLPQSDLGSTLRACCHALIARDAADPELLRGLALALGDFGPQEMEGFIRSLPGAARSLCRGRRTR